MNGVRPFVDDSGPVGGATAKPGHAGTESMPDTLWLHSWFHLERIWADLRGPEPLYRAATGVR
jgi:hypothetical protein